MVENGGSLFSLDSKPTLGSGSCWSAISPDGRWLYTANAASNSISGFSITSTGTIAPIGSTVVAQLATGSTDLDMAVSADSKFLYSLNSSAGTVGIFAIGANGALSPLPALTAFTAASGLNGIAAY